MSDRPQGGWEPLDRPVDGAPPRADAGAARPTPPPPPAPPPTGTPADPSAGGSGTGGEAWQPPRPPRRGARRWLVAVLALVVLLGLGGAGAVLSGTGEDVDPDEALSSLLDTIDRSERRMLDWQEAALLDVGGDRVVDESGLRDVSEAAADDLTAIDGDLAAIALEGDATAGLARIRDAYTGHLGAWVDYVSAVADTPDLVLDGSAEAAPYWDDIETTAGDFVAAVEQDLPADAPPRLLAKAEMILRRGFGFGPPSGELVGFDQGRRSRQAGAIRVAANSATSSSVWVRS